MENSHFPEQRGGWRLDLYCRRKAERPFALFPSPITPPGLHHPNLGENKGRRWPTPSSPPCLLPTLFPRRSDPSEIAGKGNATRRREVEKGFDADSKRWVHPGPPPRFLSCPLFSSFRSFSILFPLRLEKGFVVADVCYCPFLSR